MNSHLFILSLSCWAPGVLFRKSLPIPLFPAPSCSNFRVSGLILRSLIHFELILLHGDKHGSSFSLLQMDNHFSQQHLLKRLSFLHHLFLASLSKITQMGSVLCSTGVHVCFCASTTLFLLLLLCNIVCSLVLWYLQHWSFCYSYSYILFISSSCLIVLARSSSIMLNRSGDSGHLCLVPDFRGNCFSL
jgi:hypothetical protein